MSILTTERPPTPAERVAEWRYRYTLATWGDDFPDVTDDREPALPDSDELVPDDWWRAYPI